MHKKTTMKCVSIDAKTGEITLSNAGAEVKLKDDALSPSTLSQLDRMLKSGVVTMLVLESAKGKRISKIWHDKGGVKYNVLK